MTDVPSESDDLRQQIVVAYDNRMPSAAFPLLLRLAELEPEDRNVLHAIGVHYDQGDGIPQNSATALEWLRKAGERGHPAAAFGLAVAYDRAIGTTRDTFQAKAWLTKAASFGHSAAQCMLAELLKRGDKETPPDLTQAAYWYRQAAEKGLPKAQSGLAAMLSLGQGVPENHQEALTWFTKAAERNDAFAQFSIGYMYRKGTGVLQSNEKAVEWYRRATENGYASGQLNLGYMYLNGFGVTQDLDIAEGLFEQAAAQNDGTAKINLEFLRAVRPLIGLIAGLSKGDVSILYAMMERPGVLGTMVGTANDRLWSGLAEIGWTRSVDPPDSFKAVPEIEPRHFEFTETGSTYLSRLVTLAMGMKQADSNSS